DFSASSRTDCRTSTAAITSVTPTAASTATAIATNARARSELTTKALRLHRLVAGAANGADQVGPAEFAAQRGDVGVDGPRAARVVVAPHPLEQQVAGEDGAAVLHQVGEQVELLRPQLDRLARDAHLARAAAQDDVAQYEHRVVASGETRLSTAFMQAT